MDGSVSSTADVLASPRSREPEMPRQHAARVATTMVRDLAGIRALEPDYEHLYRAIGSPLPFARQEWHLAWCDHFLNQNSRVEDQPLFCVLREQSGDCFAIVPLILARRRVGPLTVGTVALVGSDPAITEIRGPLIKPGREQEAVRAVHEFLDQIVDWDWIQWEMVNRPLAEALGQESTPEWYQEVQACILDLPSSWEEFRAGLSRNIRESLRHCYNSLRRDGHAFELVVARRPREVFPAIERFLDLHSRRAAMARGPKHRNVFGGHATRRFLHDVCARQSAQDALRVFQLRIGGAIVASRIGFVCGDSLYLYYSGFDPEWARYSVMTTTQAEAFKYAIAHGFKSVNLSLTAEQSKARWHPRIIRFRSALVHRKRLRSRIVSAAYRLAMSRQGQSARKLSAMFWPHREWR